MSHALQIYNKLPVPISVRPGEPLIFFHLRTHQATSACHKIGSHRVDEEKSRSYHLTAFHVETYLRSIVGKSLTQAAYLGRGKLRAFPLPRT